MTHVKIDHTLRASRRSVEWRCQGKQITDRTGRPVNGPRVGRTACCFAEYICGFPLVLGAVGRRLASVNKQVGLLEIHYALTFPFHMAEEVDKD